VNFVILDYDSAEDSALADRLGVRAHPAFAVVTADTATVERRMFGPLTEAALRGLLEELAGR
jgi:hypothetical protein